MKKYELTINGLTKKAAQQLGDAYYSIADAFDIIDGMASRTASANKVICDLGREIHEYNSRARYAKQENEKLKEEIASLKANA